MFKHTSEMLRIVSSAAPRVRIFHAGDTDRYFYPYRLQAVGRKAASMRHRESCSEYILDSGIGNDDVTNEDVLDKAADLNATYVVPKDYLHEPSKTTESVVEFFEMWEDHETTAKPIVPLQPPHTDHYDELIDRLGNYAVFAVGGIKDYDDAKKVEIIKDVRSHVGHGVYLHGLGMGSGKDFVRAVRSNPNLLDSADTAAPGTNIRTGKIMHRDGTSECKIARGDDTTSVHAWHIAAQLVHLNYMISPLCDDEEVDAHLGQSDIDAFV